MFAILKRTNTSQVYFYKLNYSASDVGTDHISSVNLGTGDNNAASNYEVESGGTTYKYIFTSKGFFNGNEKIAELSVVMEHICYYPTITGALMAQTSKRLCLGFKSSVRKRLYRI